MHLKKAGIVIFLILLCSFQAWCQDYFPNGTTLKLPGSDCYRLTQAKTNENGSVWYSDKLDLSRSFKLEFSMNFGTLDANGADGIVFVLQNVGTKALGISGGGMGFNGFSPSFGIEFDTWQNTDQSDPSYDHCAILKNGSNRHAGSNHLAGPVQISQSNKNVEDGKDHHVVVEWNALSKTISVFFDCEFRLSKTVDIVQDVFNGNSIVYWGFTSATGGSVNNQIVCLRKDIIVKDSFSICRGGQVEISAGQAIDQVYSWSPVQNISNTNMQKTKVFPHTSGFYTATYKNFCNQTVQDKIWVEVTSGPQFSLGNDTMLCDGQSLTLRVNVPNLKSIIWDDASIGTSRFVNMPGTFWAKATDTAGCFSSDTIIVIPEALHVVRLGKDTVLCEGERLIFTLKTPFPVLWNDLSTAKSRTIRTGGSYSVTIITPCGSVSDTILIDFIPSPEISLGKDTALCEGNKLVLQAVDTQFVSTIWHDGSTLQDFTVMEEGIYYVEVSGKNGCTASDTIVVKYISPPESDFPGDTVVCKNQIIQLSVTGREMEVFWNGIPGGSSKEFVNYDGKVLINATNNCGELIKEVNLATKNCFCYVYYPNAITLNDDHLNETFGPVYDCIWDRYKLLIYNRWGEKVYETDQPSDSWDGTFQGNPVQGGYYVWIAQYIALENTIPVRIQKKGVVYIIR